MSTFFQNTRTYITTHKKTSIAIVVVILVVAYFIYKSRTSTSGDTTYMLGTVTQGTVVASVTGTGQVSANHELALKPLASENVVAIDKQVGDAVSTGDVIVELDTTDAEKAVRDAEASLTSAQLSLEKLQEPPSTSSLLQAQNAVTQANTALTTDYQTGFTNVSNAFLDLPNVMNGLNTVINGPSTGAVNGQDNSDFYADNAEQFESGANVGQAQTYLQAAKDAYTAALAAYDQNFTDYKGDSSSSSTATISSLITETEKTAELTSQAVKAMSDLIQYYQNTLTDTGHSPNAKSAADLSTLSGYASELNSHDSELLNSENSIASDTTDLPVATAQLAELQNGTDPLQLQSAQLSVTQAQNAVDDAKDNLQNDYVTAPFDGTIASIAVKVGDPASTGTAVATLIDNEQVVVIPLNEVNVANVKLGQKATLTFDAVSGLTLTGKVTEIDTIGTVTQGVVNYNVTISLDTTDPRIKPGMTATASIITQVDSDVLTVPSAAIKTSANGNKYVLAFTTKTPATDDTGTPVSTGTTGTTTGSAASDTVVSATPPEQVPVTTGISDGTTTEIDSGLTEGQQIVVRSIAATTAKTTTTAAPSLLGGAAGGRVGGGAAAFRGGGG